MWRIIVICDLDSQGHIANNFYSLDVDVIISSTFTEIFVRLNPTKNWNYWD